MDFRPKSHFAVGLFTHHNPRQKEMTNKRIDGSCGATKLGRQDLLALITPEGTDTHRLVPHSQIVGGLIEALGYRHLEVKRDEYAVTPDGNRMFGFLEISEEVTGVRFGIGCRNSHDNSFSLGLTVATGSSFATTSHSTATSRRLRESTRRTSTPLKSSMPQSARCSGTLNQ
jgi:hypothetical protein